MPKKWGHHHHHPSAPPVAQDPMILRTPRSQKAKGLRRLRDARLKVPKFTLVQSTGDINQAWYYLKQQMPLVRRVFGRPCPESPAHGFVESREVHDANDVATLLAEAQAVDPKAEVLLCARIQAEANAIYRPGLLVVGPGHDGATGGHDSWSLPLVDSADTWLTSMMLGSGINAVDEFGIPQVGYIEAVYTSRGELFYTQLRGGPRIQSMGPNYVPHDFEVKHVVVATMDIDLVKWKVMCAEFETGTVVYHPGGNLASHIFIHCYQHGIPCITEGSEPKPGDVLEATDVGERPDPKAVRDGVAAGTAIFIDSGTHRELMVKVAAAALHNAVAQSGLFGFNLGVAAVLMHRLGLSACLGELRHAPRLRKNPKKYRELVGAEKAKNLPTVGHSAQVHMSGSEPRNWVYENALNRPFNGRRKLHKALSIFLHDKWGGAMGGEAWARCTIAVCKLDDAIRAVAHNPTDGTVTELVTALNEVVNQAHNTGWFLNKFASKDVFDKMAQGYVPYLLETAPTFLEARQVPPETLEAAMESWLMARPTRWETAGIVKLTAPKPVAPAILDNYEYVTPTPPQPTKIGLAHPVTHAQMKFDGDEAHIQYTVKGETGYRKMDVTIPPGVHQELPKAKEAFDWVQSLANTHTMYVKLNVLQVFGPAFGLFIPGTVTPLTVIPFEDVTNVQTEQVSPPAPAAKPTQAPLEFTDDPAVAKLKALKKKLSSGGVNSITFSELAELEQLIEEKIKKGGQ